MDWILKYWVEWSFGIIGTLLVAGFHRLRRLSAVGKGVQALLRDRIIQAYNHYTEKGYCPIYSRENVEKMYKEYHALGGNGTITELVERIRELPTERKEEENGH